MRKSGEDLDWTRDMTRLKHVRCVENPRISYSFSTYSDGNTDILSFPQKEEGFGFLATINERRFLNIFTLSTTTNFFL